MKQKKSSNLDPAEITFFEQIQFLINVDPINLPNRLTTLCGVDSAYSEEENRVFSTAVSFVDGLHSETATYEGMFSLPYVSGLFYLHEGPFAVAAVRKLQNKPELVCFDAHGIAHPRGKGLAMIGGMLLGIPSIGIAKTALVGDRVPYKQGLDKLRFKDNDVGFVTLSESEKFWSQGYSVTLAELERIISMHCKTVLKALELAHNISRESISNSAKKSNEN
jgi:deoxyinosine 3'endonuclease (endonuclease V)